MARPNREAETLFKEPEKMAKLFAEMGKYNEELVKAPNPMPGEESGLEIRPYYEAADFGEGFTLRMSSPAFDST